MIHHHHGSQVASENYDKQPLTIKAIYEADMAYTLSVCLETCIQMCCVAMDTLR